MTISANHSVAPGLYRILVEGLGVNVVSHGAFATLNITATPAPAAPALSSPGNGAAGVAASTALSWGTVSSATSYDVYLGIGSALSLVANVASNSYKPSAALTAGASYSWRVVAKNSSGSSPASATWSFTVQPAVPAAPALSSPGNGAAGVAASAALSWGTVSGATSYDVYLGIGSALSFVANVASNSYKPSAALTAGASYSWRVVAKNSSGSSPASATWSFTVQPAAPKILGYSFTAAPRSRQYFNGAITGSGFISGTQVWFCVNGGSACYQQPAGLVNVSSQGSLSISNINLTAGSWQIYVQTPYGQSARSLSFSVAP